MYGMFSTLIAIAQLAAAVLMAIIMVGLAIEHPVAALIGFALFYIIVLRPVVRWFRRQWVTEVRRQRSL